MDYKDMLDCILEWAETHPNFDASVFESIESYYYDQGEFTGRQQDAIENVYYKWRVDIWADFNR